VPSTFHSTTINKLDAKGRVSVPAQFRQVLAIENLRGVYSFPSFVNPALEAFGESLLAQIQQRLQPLDSFFNQDYDAQAHVIVGETQLLNFDDEGRIRLPDEFIAHAGISDRVLFIGMVQKFQMWDPEKFEPVRRERIARALALRNGGAA
jgi:MraZ protein